MDDFTGTIIVGGLGGLVLCYMWAQLKAALEDIKLANQKNGAMEETLDFAYQMLTDDQRNSMEWVYKENMEKFE